MITVCIECGNQNISEDRGISCKLGNNREPGKGAEPGDETWFGVTDFYCLRCKTSWWELRD